MPVLLFFQDFLVASLLLHLYGNLDYMIMFVRIGWGIKLYPHHAGFLGVACCDFFHCSFPSTFTFKSLLAVLCLQENKQKIQGDEI